MRFFVFLFKERKTVFSCPRKKGLLIQVLKFGSGNTKVFKDVMFGFCTKEAEWEKINANEFFAIDPEIIDAAIHFINEHNPNAACMLIQLKAFVYNIIICL